MPIQILKYSSLIFILLVLIVGLFFYNFQAVESQGVSFDFAGWIWSENYGWVSLNSKNCELLNPGECLTGYAYSVKINPANEVSGYGWSENVGWVCFGNGNGDLTAGCGGTPPSGSLNTTLDETSGQITGWAKVTSLDNDGWIKLGRGSGAGSNFGEACYDCQPHCDTWTIVMQGEPPKPVEVPPCLVYSETNFDSCSTCFTRTKFDGINIPDPATESVSGGSEYICSSCTDCRKVDGAVPGTSRIVCNQDNGASGRCNSCELYGVNRNLADGRLLGWAWNGTSDGVTGAGWLHFNAEFGNSYIVFPWLQTVYGSIYTPNLVRQKAGVEGRNATYCIFAQDININIKAQNCENIASGLVTGVDTGFPVEDVSGGIYRNALGKIDIEGLTRKTSPSGNRNKYGQIVNESSASSWTGPSDGVLKGEVYYFTGDLQIPSSGLTFLNGANVSGNGIIIIEDDLLINGEINYGAGVPAKLKELASVAWIVKGDVKVDPNVEKVAGAFIVLGDGLSCQIDPASNPDYPEYVANKCGVFFSGASDKPFTNLGLIIAKAFDFRRTFAEILQGSERIIYDGRLSTNPPPGLIGFVEGLPIIRDFSY